MKYRFSYSLLNRTMWDLLLLLFPLVVLAGCAGIVKQAPPGVVLPSTGDEVLVFGRIMWIQNGEERESYSDIALSVLRAEDMKKGSIAVEKDGGFFALLPRGSYLINEINWRDPWDGPHWIVPKVVFKVGEDRHIYYLGTLVVDLKAKRDIIGGLWVKDVGISIDDEDEKAMKGFRNRYPEQEVKIAKALMIHDSRIPNFDELESQRQLLDLILKIIPVAPVLFNP